MEKEIYCGCGYGEGEKHILGQGSCCRERITNIEELPKNERIINADIPFSNPIKVYDLENEIVSDYTLFNQRLYAVDSEGNWSRPKLKDSVNSLEGDW